MSESRKSRALLAFFLGTLAVSAALAEDASGRPIFEADVVRLSAEHNPQLRVALLQAESARWEATGLEARYAPVIAADASLTQTKTPMLTRAFPTGGAGTAAVPDGQMDPDGQMNAGGGGTNTAGANAILQSIPALAVTGERRADTGLELRKHTLWGTDIALRVAPYVRQSYAPPGVLSFNPVGWSRPQYGGLVKLSLTQPLIRGRGRAVNEAQLLAARVQRDSSQHTRDRVASEVVRDALNAYWELWYAGKSLAIERESREVALKQRDEAKARVATGSLAPVEVLAFETQVATREEAILNARLAYRQRELELLEKMGATDQPELSALRAESEPVAALPARDAAERGALAESAELKELFSSSQLAQLEQRTATDQYRAKLDFTAYVQGQGLLYNTPDDNLWLNQFNAISGMVGLNFEAPVNRKRERAEANKARLAAEVAEQNLRQARQRIVTQIGVLHEKGRSSEEAVLLAEKTLEIARQQLAAEQARYATGSSTSVQVLEAEDKVRSAQLRVARLQADFMESVLAIAHYTGELLDRYAGVVSGR